MQIKSIEERLSDLESRILKLENPGRENPEIGFGNPATPLKINPTLYKKKHDYRRLSYRIIPEAGKFRVVLDTKLVGIAETIEAAQELVTLDIESSSK